MVVCKLRILVLLVCYSTFLISCNPFNNNYQEEVLRCGSDAQPNTNYVQVLGPDGNTIPGKSLVVTSIAEGASECISPSLSG